MGASPNPAPPAPPPSPVEPPAVSLPATPPPDSTTGASKGLIRDELDAMMAEPERPVPGKPEPEKPPEKTEPEQKAAPQPKPEQAAEPEQEPEREASGEKPPSEAEFPDDGKQSVSSLDDELLFEDEKDESEEPEQEAASPESESGKKIDAKEAKADADLDKLLKRRQELSAKGTADKKLDDEIRGAFLSKNRGKRMLESDNYRIEIQETFGELPTVDQLKAQRRAHEGLIDMSEDLNSGDPVRVQSFFEHWLTPLADPRDPAKGRALAPGAPAALASLPYFLATNRATAPIWQEHIVPQVASYIADGLYARAKTASSDLDRRGMFSTAQWLDQVFSGQVRANSIEETPKARANGRSEPDPEMQRVLSENDRMRQQLEASHSHTRKMELDSVMDGSEGLVGKDIDYSFRDVKDKYPARVWKAFRADVIRGIAGELASDRDFLRSFERKFNSAFMQGDRESIDQLPKLYRDKARAFLRRNYKSYRAELSSASGGGSIEESKQRHEKHAKAQEKTAPGGGKAAPSIRMAPIGDRRENESTKDYLTRELSS